MQILAKSGGEEFYNGNPYFVMLVKGNEVLFSKDEDNEDNVKLKKAKEEYIEILEKNKDNLVCAIDIHY